MVSLALETSSHRGSLALFELSKNSHQILYSTFWEKQNSHTELVTVEIAKAFEAASTPISALKLLAVGVGPGSFTGIRVGVNAVRSLAYALEIPVFCVNSLRILAESAQGRTQLPVMPMINAFKNQVFWARYSHNSQTGELDERQAPSVADLENIDQVVTEPTLIVGDIFHLASFSPSQRARMLTLSDLDLYPHANALARLTSLTHPPGLFLSWKEVMPLYLRASSAEETMKRRK